MFISIKKNSMAYSSLIPFQLENFALLQAGASTDIPINMDPVDGMNIRGSSWQHVMIPDTLADMVWPHKPYFILGLKNKKDIHPVCVKYAALHFLDGEFEPIGHPSELWNPEQWMLDELRESFARPSMDPDLGLQQWAGKITLWEEAIIKWNDHVGILDLALADPYSDLINGNVSDSIKNNPSYVPFNTPIPHWTAKRKEVIKNGY